jgi:hypothetical protein
MAKKIKDIKMNFIVTATVTCTDPELFESQLEFDKNDGGDMGKYIKEELAERLDDMWHGAAAVARFSVTQLPR